MNRLCNTQLLSTADSIFDFTRHVFVLLVVLIGVQVTVDSELA